MAFRMKVFIAIRNERQCPEAGMSFFRDPRPAFSNAAAPTHSVISEKPCWQLGRGTMSLPVFTANLGGEWIVCATREDADAISLAGDLLDQLEPGGCTPHMIELLAHT